MLFGFLLTRRYNLMKFDLELVTDSYTSCLPLNNALLNANKQEKIITTTYKKSKYIVVSLLE